MEAIIQSDGRQYKVVEGATVDVDYREELKEGSSLEFSDVLYVTKDGDSTVGTPTISGAKVVGTVVGHVRGPKLVVMNFRRRKNSRRRVGHRQSYTRVKIDRIEAS